MSNLHVDMKNTDCTFCSRKEHVQQTNKTLNICVQNNITHQSESAFY